MKNQQGKHQILEPVYDIKGLRCSDSMFAACKTQFSPELIPLPRAVQASFPQLPTVTSHGLHTVTVLPHIAWNQQLFLTMEEDSRTPLLMYSL